MSDEDFSERRWTEGLPNQRTDGLKGTNLEGITDCRQETHLSLHVAHLGAQGTLGSPTRGTKTNRGACKLCYSRQGQLREP